MATPTYTLLDSVTLGSSASSVTFSSISQDYGDLVLVIDGSLTNGTTYLRMNGDSGANYSSVYAYGDGSSTGSNSRTSRNEITIGEITYFPTAVKALWKTEIMDYSATDKHKTVLSRSNSPSTGTDMIAGRWANTSAVTSLTVGADGGGQLATGSTFHLYGIEA